MKLLVVGSGGREHALAWKLAQSPRVQMVYVAPGNGGTAQDERLLNVDITDPAALADFAEKEQIALTVVGPEGPLAAGIVNLFRSRGLKIFGPTKEAAQLESSKDFAKAFMKRHAIPTAEYETFTDIAAAHAYLDTKARPSSSRLTDSLPVRAWSWQRRLKKRTRPSIPCSPTTNWATLVRAW